MADDDVPLPHDDLPDDAVFAPSQQVADDAYMILAGKGMPIERTWMDHDGTTLQIVFNEEADGLEINVQLESALYGLNTMGGYRMWLSHLAMMVIARFQELSPYTQQRRKLRMDEQSAIASIMRSAKATQAVDSGPSS